MGDSKINLETQVNISMKMFLALIGGMLSLFFGFYSLVVAPRLSNLENDNIKIKEEQVNQYKEMNKHLIELNNGIGTLGGSVEGLIGRFNDLKDLNNNNENTSGGFNNN